MVGLRKFKPMGRDGAANLTRLLLKSNSTAQTKKASVEDRLPPLKPACSLQILDEAEKNPDLETPQSQILFDQSPLQNETEKVAEKDRFRRAGQKI